MTERRENLPRVHVEFLLVAVIFLTAGALRINDLFLYTPDSARYLIWGSSIARGEGYLDDTQPEPLRYVIHAPLYPALIAPVEFFFPMQVVPVKVATLLWGLLALLLLYLWLYHLFGRISALAGALMLAFNPAFLVYSTEPLSEAPFAALLLLVLYIAARSEGRGALSRPGWWTLLAATSLIGLLREVGVVVTACVAFSLWSRDRKKALAVIACGAVCVGAWYVRNSLVVGAPPGSPGGNASLVLQHFRTGPDESVITEIVMRTWSNVSSYFVQIGGAAFYPLYGPQHMLLLEAPVDIPPALSWCIVIVFGALMAYGIVGSTRSGKRGTLPVAVGAALFLAAAVYPVRDARFLAPLLPLMIVFFLGALTALGRNIGRTGGTLMAAAALVVLPNLPALYGLISLNGRYISSPEALHSSLAGREVYPYYYTQPWGLLRAWMDEHLPKDAVFATPAKELAVVAGGRKVIELDPGLPQSVFDRLLRTNGVSYLLAPARWSDLKVYESLMSGSRRCDFRELHRVGNLHLYEVRFRPFDRAHGPPVAPSPEGGAAGYLRAARELIMTGDYGGASALLESAVRIAPTRPEIRYEVVVAAALGGDSVSAADAFRQLMGLQQVASYINPARLHLRMADAVRTLSALPPGAGRVMRMLDVSRNYWDMGCYDRAKRLLGPEMSGDSTFFVGHLWDFHFNFQTGDTAAARRSLARLDRIDSANSLVRNFHALMDLRKVVHSSSPSAETSALRLRMAQIYRDIELFDESYDQAEAAIADDPSSRGALLFLADLYAKQGYSRRALPFYREYLVLVPGDSAVRARADSLPAPPSP